MARVRKRKMPNHRSPQLAASFIDIIYHPMDDKTINPAGLAELFGVSDRVVREHTASGVLVKTGRNYALLPNVSNYCAHLRKLAMMRGGGEAAIATATIERGRLAKAQADHVETKNAKARGELVEATAVEAEWSGIMRTVRAGMLAVPSRVQQRLPHLTMHDVAEIDAEVRAALVEAAETNEADDGLVTGLDH